MPSDQGASTLQDELGNAGDVGNLKGETSCTTAITCTVIGNQLMNNKTGGHRYSLAKFHKNKVRFKHQNIVLFLAISVHKIPKISFWLLGGMGVQEKRTDG